MCDYILNSGTNSFNLDLMFDTLLGLSGALNCFTRVPRVFSFRYFHTHAVLHSDNRPVYQSVCWNSYSVKLENLQETDKLLGGNDLPKINPRRQKITYRRSWKDGSARKVFASQQWGPKLNLQRSCKKARHSGTHLKPCYQGGGERGSSSIHW